MKAFNALNACHFEVAIAMRMRAERAAREKAGDKEAPPAPPPGPDCAGVSEKDWADSMKYLKRAAEMGDERAIYQYASGLPFAYSDEQELFMHPEAVMEWRQDSSRLLIGAAESGSLDAILSLSDAYETGRLGEKNPLLAYQYMLAAREATGSATFDTNANRLASQLTPEQIANAQEGARSLIARCCRSK
jgi:TPR repeat protein